MKKLLRSLVRNESGQGALITVLILLVLGAFLTVPLLNLMGTGLQAGRVHEEKAEEFYAADAGVEDAINKIRINALPLWMQGNWGEDTYSNGSYEYDIGPQINGKDTTVAIQPIWVLQGLEEPSLEQQRQPYDDLVTVGDVIAPGEYQIKLIRSENLTDELKIERIGCWLPAGFEYVVNSSNLEQNETGAYYCVPQTFAYGGGTAITWDYEPALTYDELPGSTNEKMVTFEFTPTDKSPQGSFSWMRTDRDDIYHLSWDIDCKLFKIISTATDPVSNKLSTVTAYTSKNEFRKFGSAVSGDYCVTGGTLMTSTEDPKYRDRLFEESSATMQSKTLEELEEIEEAGGVPQGYILEGAHIDAAYLYWSGWIEMGDLESAKVYRVIFNDIPITADQCQVNSTPDSDAPDSWSYSCSCDVTDYVTGIIGEFVPEDMSAIFTVGHWLEDGTEVYQLYPYGEGGVPTATTGYPLATPAACTGFWCTRYQWSYAGWSLIIIYSSPETSGHQLYLFDTFRYIGLRTTLEILISGFLAPSSTAGSHLTYFVGEGDDHYTGDSIEVNGDPLSDPPDNPWDNIFNSYSNTIDDPILNEPLFKSGIDIDTFDMSDCIDPGDTSAEVILESGSEIYDLVYIILSFRSETTTGGFLSFEIETG